MSEIKITDQGIQPKVGDFNSLQGIPNIQEIAMEKAAIEAALKKRKERVSADNSRLEIFRKNKKRVNLFNKHHSINPARDIVAVEFFVTYPKEKDTDLAGLSSLGINATQESNMILYPIVKDLHTGTLHSVADHLSMMSPNPDYEPWVEKAAGSPQFKEAVPKPPQMMYGCEMQFAQHRFELIKLDPEMTPQSYYTFMVPSSVLLTELK